MMRNEPSRQAKRGQLKFLDSSATPPDLESPAEPSRPPRRPPNSEPVDASSAEAEEYVLVDDTQALEFDRAVDRKSILSLLFFPP